MKKIFLAIAIAITFALTIISVLPNKIYASQIDKNTISKTNNILDSANLYQGTTLGVSGLPVIEPNNFSRVVSKEFISVFPNTTYSLTCYNSNMQLFEVNYYDKNKNCLALNTINENDYQFTTPDNCYYIILLFRMKDNSTIYVNDVVSSVMFNLGTNYLAYEPYIPLENNKGYQDGYNQALIDNMYWLNEFNTTIVDIKELGSNYSAKENDFLIMPIEYKTGLYGSANFNDLVYDFASYIADYESIMEQEIEIELSFESPILLNNEIRFTTNDITGFTFISESKNEYNYDFVFTSEGAKDYLHDFTNLNEPYSFMNKPIKAMKIRFIQTRYSTTPNPSISFVANLFNEGYSQGYDEGNANGYNQGFNGGYDKGYDEGFFSGYQGGYNEGVQNGDLKSTGLQQMFLTILGFPITALQGIFNFEIFGINLLSLITFILTIGIVVFVIKKFI